MAAETFHTVVLEMPREAAISWRVTFSYGSGSFQHALHFSVGMEKEHISVVSGGAGEQEGAAGGFHGDRKIPAEGNVCLVGA